MRPYSPGGVLNTFASAGGGIGPLPTQYPSFTARTTGVSNPVCSPSFRTSASEKIQQVAFATGVPSNLNTFHRPLEVPPAPTFLERRSLEGNATVEPIAFHPPLTPPPTCSLSPMIPNNVRTVRLTAAAGTNLARASSGVHSLNCSPPTGVYNPKAFFLHAASLGQAFAHCRRFSTAASRRSLASVSVPVARVVLSHPLAVVALVSHHLTN